jgi:hypothetical protein
MTNPALKDSIGMPRNETGCLVMDVAQWTNAAEHLKKDDVVLSIDGMYVYVYRYLHIYTYIYIYMPGDGCGPVDQRRRAPQEG